MPAVHMEMRRVYRVAGGRSRFTKAAAYREAARVRIRKACSCVFEPDVNWSELCRFHGGEVDGYAEGPLELFSEELGEMRDDGGRGYYLLVRERLMRWLAWADGVRADRLTNG